MSNSFDIQFEDQYLQFIRQDSVNNNYELFHSYQPLVKSEEQQVINQRQQVNDKSSGKRRRNQNSGKSNSRKKVFYRDRMANLMTDQEAFNCEGYNYGDYSQNSRGKSPISRDEQLRRNRESAKHSRQRRKQYVQALEIRNNQNQKKIQQLSLLLRQAQMQRDRLKQDNRSYVKSFLAAKNEAYQNLSNALKKCGKQSSDKLNQQLQILFSRYGAAGAQRIAATDYYMKQIIQILLGDIHKYIVDCAVNDTGLFGLGGWSKLDQQICQVLKTNKQNRIKLSRTYKSQMVNQFQTFKAVTQKFYDAYRSVQNQAKIIQKIFGKIILQFNDVNIAQLLLWIEQNKFSKELKKIRAEWARSVEQPEQPIGKARKLHSTEIMQTQF